MHKKRRRGGGREGWREGEGEGGREREILLHYPVSHCHGRSFDTRDGIILTFFGKLNMGMKLVLSLSSVIIVVCSILRIIV